MGFLVLWIVYFSLIFHVFYFGGKFCCSQAKCFDNFAMFYCFSSFSYIIFRIFRKKGFFSSTQSGNNLQNIGLFKKLLEIIEMLYNVFENKINSYLFYWGKSVGKTELLGAAQFLWCCQGQNYFLFFWERLLPWVLCQQFHFVPYE